VAKRRKKESEFWFDDAAAARAVGFVEEVCVHSKGEWAGQNLHLEPWERDLVRRIFGWKRRDGTRRYRQVYVFVPRKNGKTTLGAAIALYMLLCDGEAGAEVYSAAADKGQAALVFKEAKAMVMASALLLEQCQPYRTAIVAGATLSAYQVLSSDVETKHGLNASCVVFDELHTQPSRHLYDVLLTSMGARRQPLMLMFTTAGFDKLSFCYEIHEYALKISSGVIVDDEWLVIMFMADEKDDWQAEATWRKANPSMAAGTPKIDYLRARAREAKDNPAAENTFRRLHLNQWTSQETKWISLEVWDANNKKPAADLAKRRCFVGLDLSQTTDLTAAVAVFPRDDGSFDTRAQFWLPRANIAVLEQRARAPYQQWGKRRLITLTEGNVVDYSFIRAELNAWAIAYDVVEIAYDPYNATQLAVQLQEDDGLPMVEFRQGFVSMNEPMKTVEGILLDHRLRHGGHPVLRWNFDNLAVTQDAAGNLKPAKNKSRGKIDGIVALIMAVGRATLSRDEVSVYEQRGMVDLS
jgi:phage terminase large subunit-like protein